MLYFLTQSGVFYHPDTLLELLILLNPDDGSKEVVSLLCPLHLYYYPSLDFG